MPTKLSLPSWSAKLLAPTGKRANKAYVSPEKKVEFQSWEDAGVRAH